MKSWEQARQYMDDKQPSAAFWCADGLTPRSAADTVLLLAAAVVAQQTDRALPVALQVDVHQPPELQANAGYVLAACGDPRASDFLRRAVDARRPLLDVWQKAGELLPAVQLEFFRYLWVEDGDPQAGYFVARAQREAGDLQGARATNLNAMAAQGLPDDLASGLRGNLAAIEKDCGRVTHAVHIYLDDVRQRPDAGRHSNALMCMNYSPAYSLADYSAEAARWSDDHCSVDQHAPDCYDRPTIGLIGGDFCGTALASLMLPVVRQLRAVTDLPIHIYHTRDRRDRVTELFEQSVDQLVMQPADDQLAERIYHDRVGILVDVTGHTSNNGLPVLCRRPAFTQVGWLSGMMCPPEITAVSHYIGSQAAQPPDAQSTCRNQLIGLPQAFSYTPDINQPTPPQLPADGSGHLTFGSFNNPCKIHQQVVRVWRQLLTDIPNSRFICKVISPDHRRQLTEWFGDVSCRVTFVQHLPRKSDVHDRYLREIDLAVDCWPCGGCLTTLEAAWCGVPTLTLRGPTFSHLQSWAVLSALDCLPFGVDTPDDFLAAARQLADDPQPLRVFRRDCRELFQASELFNHRQIADNLLQALLQAHQENREALTCSSSM